VLLINGHFKKKTLIKALFITTSCDLLDDQPGKTGIWLEEIAAPYYYFKEAGVEVTVASPKGGGIPIDPKSLSIMVATRSTKKFLKDPEAMELIAHSRKLEFIHPEDYSLVFLPSGYGALSDLCENSVLNLLMAFFVDNDRPIGIVGYGVTALFSLKQANGEPFVKDRQVTCFSNSEITSRGLATLVPFLPELLLKSVGAVYSKGADYESYVVADGNLVSGQNPASAELVAKKLLTITPRKESIPAFYSPSLT